MSPNCLEQSEATEKKKWRLLFFQRQKCSAQGLWRQMRVLSSGLDYDLTKTSSMLSLFCLYSRSDPDCRTSGLPGVSLSLSPLFNNCVQHLCKPAFWVERSFLNCSQFVPNNLLLDLRLLLWLMTSQNTPLIYY